MSPGEVAAIMFGVFAILILLRIPVSFALGLACIPVLLIDPRLTPFLLINEMWKSYNAFILLAVPFFLLAANLMNSAGITERLVSLARATVGHLPGGLGHINVMVSMLFAGISGSSTADAAGIGSLLIPAMKKQGYDTEFSVAITACSSVMGVIIPPSIMMVVWGGLMSVSIGGLFLGVVPGALIAISMMGTVLIYAKARDYPIYQRASFKEFQALGKSVFALVSPAIIVGGIVGGLFTPTEASEAVIYSAILGGIVYRTIGPKEFTVVPYNSARLAAISLFCIGTASAFGWLLAYFRVPKHLWTSFLDTAPALPQPAFSSPSLPGHRHVYRCHPGNYYPWYDPFPTCRERRHASNSFRHYRRHVPRFWIGHPALWPLPSFLAPLGK